ncbi:MAG: SatD family protein [Lachnospiraceae bacterium]|nr:SatD family protein [Lachnospiraceae bacterium]
MLYYAIIGDIKDSKKIDNRDTVQDKLRRTLDKVNVDYKEGIAANFLITLGDEFQGLLKRPDDIIALVKYIQNEMYPVQIRFGIGIGEIKTTIDHEAALGADGPAYYAARNAITEIRESEKREKKQAADVKLATYGKESFEMIEINCLLGMIKVIENGWNPEQRFTIMDMLVHQDSQENCAKRLQTTQPTVARRLSAGNFLVYKNALDTLNMAMRRVKNEGK